VCAFSAGGEGELDPALFIGCVGGREIEIAQRHLPRVVLGEYPQGLPDDAVVLDFAAMAVPEHEERGRRLFHCRAWTWRWCLTGCLFLPQPFNFFRQSVNLSTKLAVVVRLLHDRVWLLNVLRLRPEQRRVVQELIREEESSAEERISEARVGSNKEMVMMPEARVDEKRVPESPRRHEADAASRDAARSRRSHARSYAAWGSCGKSALGLEGGRQDRDRPQYRE
jgi:hypothetical protein